MKRIFCCFLIIYIFFLAFPSCSAQDTEKPELFYFYSSNCLECELLKKEFFPELEKKYSGKVIWTEMNIAESAEALELAHRLVLGEKKFGTIAPSAVIGDVVLTGQREIRSGMENAIKHALSTGISRSRKPSDNTPAELSLFFSRRISLPVVILAGLIDGINPCAFAAIAFLISLMHVRSFSKKEVAAVAASYCAAVFLVYFFVGFGAFEAVYALRNFYKASRVFHLCVATLCFALAGASLYDFFIYRRSGKAKGLILSLPKTLRKKISLTIGSGIRDKRSKSLFFLSLGAFSAGGAVSLMEMVCTGQIYLPTLVYIMRNSPHRTKAFLYILLYNFMFVLPLVAVSLIYIRTSRSEISGALVKRHGGNVKLLLAALFTLLGTLILLSR
ncbi:MAG: hypothetical protein WCV56_08195 [Candidatus Omnitrophota bacterium]